MRKRREGRGERERGGARGVEKADRDQRQILKRQKYEKVNES